MPRRNANAGQVRYDPDSAALASMRDTMGLLTAGQLAALAASTDPAAALVAECEITFRAVAS